jgi:hypothetical protein
VGSSPPVVVSQFEKTLSIMAKSFRNGCERPGREGSVTKRNLPAQELRSLLRGMFGASEAKRLERTTAAAWESAGTLHLLSDGLAARRRAVLVLWGDSPVSFSKDITQLPLENIG